MDREPLLGLELEANGGDDLSIRRKAEIVDILDSNIQATEFPSIAGVPDLESLLPEIRDHELAIGRIRDSVDPSILTESDSAQPQ